MRNNPQVDSASPSVPLQELYLAKKHLERPGMIVSGLDWLSGKAESVLNWLPEIVRKAIGKIGEWALGRALFLALTTINVGSRRKPSPRTHKILTMLAGAFGGSLGWLTMMIELPITTVLMLRGIAEVARAEGEDLTLPEARMACLSVFAMTRPNKKNNTWRFLSTRSALQKLVGEATQAAARKGAAARSAPAVVRLVSKIAGRFGIVISEKAVAQGIPLLGIIGGASINGLLTHHYLTLARGYFSLRRLERDHGEVWVRQNYDAIRL